MNTNEKTILIAKMYVGNYLNEGENIGHEIINLFKDDNGKNYIFITPYGNVNNINNIETVLMIGKTENGVTEIIAKATDLTPVYDDDGLNQQRNYIDKNNIKYAGIKLYDFFKYNTYKQEKEKIFYITFQAGNVLFPKEKIYLTEDKRKEKDNCIFISLGLPRQSMHQFYDENEKSFNNLINDETKWETENKTKKLSKNLNFNIMLNRFIKKIIDNEKNK